MGILGRAIFRLRYNRGLTQHELGELCDPPRVKQAVTHWEGRDVLKEDTLDLVARALGLDVRDALLEGLGVVGPPPFEVCVQRGGLLRHRCVFHANGGGGADPCSPFAPVIPHDDP